MIDISKQEFSGESVQQLEQCDAATLRAEPVERSSNHTTGEAGVSVINIKSKVASLPKTVQQSLDSGEGDNVIDAIQDMIQTAIGSIFSSCRIASLRVCLLSDSDKSAVSRVVYIIAFVLFAVFIITLLISFSWGTVLLGVECMLAAYVADRIIHTPSINIIRKGVKKQTAAQRKPRQSQFDDSEYL